MKIVIRLIFFGIILLLNTAYNAEAKTEIPAGVDLLKIKRAATFKVFMPFDSSRKTEGTVEVKSPYPLDTTKPIEKLRLHYFDKEGKYEVGIEQAKADNLTREEMIKDEKTNRTQRIIIKYKPTCTKKNSIEINDYKGCFKGFAKNPKGGVLWWIQDGTYIQMDSHSLTKTEMFKIAKSMQ